MNKSSESILTTLYDGCVNRTDIDSADDGGADNGAVIYIVAVLVFYSTGIVIMIIKYLKTERQEQEEEAILANFFKGMPNCRQTMEQDVNKVAIRAFHTLTTSAYTDNGASTRTLLVTDV